jgi:Domain of unknown function (DUF4389)
MRRRRTAAVLHSRAVAHPINVVVDDDLQRSRLTVFFRGLLALPHWIWVSLWGIAATLAALGGWFATLVLGRLPDGLHNFLGRFLRYQTQVLAYSLLAADPFPDFAGDKRYPVDLEVAAPEAQNRLTVFFRLLLAIPAAILSTLLTYVGELVALFAWFVALFLGRVPEGMRNLIVFAIRYHIQTQAYQLLLTQRYPSLSTD